MADFTDSLIKNIGAHSASPNMPTVSMSNLGEKLRQARTYSLASLSQALKTTTAPATTNNKTNTTTESVSLHAPAPEKAGGKLEINIVEGRNLTIADALKADTYCIVEFEGNRTSTLEKSDDDGILPDIKQDKTTNNSGAFKPFEIMMLASSPKWMHRVVFDVTSSHKELSVHVYDRGNRLPNGEDRFLGTCTIVPSLVSKKTVELVFPLKSRPGDSQEVTGDVRLQVTYTDSQAAKLTPEDFRIIRMIGQGSVGKVYEVVKRDTKRTYAMKVLSKRLLVEENVVDNAFTERNVLVQSLSNPFIANLKFSFQTANHLFLVMDYFPSGELYDFLERERCMSEKRCQFFAAEIVCAFDHIHSRNIVYRNLKPESILLDAQGHLALTDFGLCKQLSTKDDLIKDEIPKKSIPEYLAPEMVLHKPYGTAVDWWSLGILLYELLTGSPPFHSVDDEDLFKQILESDVIFPEGGCVSDQGKNFIEALLQRDPSQRLGSNGLGEIKNHPFFDGVNWEVVYKKQMQLPFVAEVEEHFRDEAAAAVTAKSISIPNTKSTSNPAPSSFLGTTPITNQPNFKGFSYVADDTFIKKGEHILGINPEDEDPEIDFWFRK